MRTMVDACSPANLPAGHDLYATYVDGGCAVAAGTAVRISSIATPAGNTGDCEPGNPGWTAWVAWVVHRRAAGVDPTIYCMDDGYGDDSVWNGWRHADGGAAFKAAGVTEPHWWVCHPGASAVPGYAVAVQTGLNIAPGYDISIVADHWPGIDPAPSQENDMIILTTAGQPALFVFGDGAVGIPDQATETALTDAGVKVAAVTASFYTAVLTAANLRTAGAPLAGSVTFTPSGSIELTAS